MIGKVHDLKPANYRQCPHCEKPTCFLYIQTPNGVIYTFILCCVILWTFKEAEMKAETVSSESFWNVSCFASTLLLVVERKGVGSFSQQSHLCGFDAHLHESDHLQILSLPSLYFIRVKRSTEGVTNVARFSCFIQFCAFHWECIETDSSLYWI